MRVNVKVIWDYLVNNNNYFQELILSCLELKLKPHKVPDKGYKNVYSYKNNHFCVHTFGGLSD